MRSSSLEAKLRLKISPLPSIACHTCSKLNSRNNLAANLELLVDCAWLNHDLETQCLGNAPQIGPSECQSRYCGAMDSAFACPGRRRVVAKCLSNFPEGFVAKTLPRSR